MCKGNLQIRIDGNIHTKTAVSWTFFGAQGKVNTPFFWKLAANEFLLQYFFCRMSGRGEKKVKNGKKNVENGQKKNQLKA